MKKIFNNFKLLPISTIAIASLSIIPITSCNDNKQHVDISSIELNLRPNYICPGNTVKVNKTIYPAEAYDNELKWEIVDCPYNGFTISQNGEITAPNDIHIAQPTMMHIKASDPSDPKVNATLAIGIINEPQEGQKFLGFANNEIIYKDVNGNDASMPIVKKDETHYETKSPIELFIGRPTETIDFLPIFGKSQNNRMKFHLHGDDPEHLRSLSWYAYADNSWTYNIPTFRVTFVQYKHDSIDVSFACDEEIKFRINFNVYQSPQQETAGCMSFIPPEGSYQKIIETSPGIYQAPIRLPYNNDHKSHEETMNGIYVYRKPYEKLYDLSFKIEYLCPDIVGPEMFNVTYTAQRVVLREFDDYEAYKVDLCVWYDSSYFGDLATKYDFESIPMFTLRASDQYNDNICYCTFNAYWALVSMSNMGGN